MKLPRDEWSFCSVHCSKDFICFTTGQITPKISPSGPPSNTCSLDTPKRHVDRFSHFCWVHERDQQSILTSLRPVLGLYDIQPRLFSHARGLYSASDDWHFWPGPRRRVSRLMSWPHSEWQWIRCEVTEPGTESLRSSPARVPSRSAPRSAAIRTSSASPDRIRDLRIHWLVWTRCVEQCRHSRRHRRPAGDVELASVQGQGHDLDRLLLLHRLQPHPHQPGNYSMHIHSQAIYIFIFTFSPLVKLLWKPPTLRGVKTTAVYNHRET